MRILHSGRHIPLAAFAAILLLLFSLISLLAKVDDSKKNISISAQQLEEKIKAIIEHKNLRDMEFIAKLFAVDWDDPITPGISSYDHMASTMHKYPYARKDLYSFNLLLGRKNHDYRLSYIVTVYGDHPPRANTALAGADLRLDWLPKDACIHINDLEFMLTSQGRKESILKSGPQTNIYQFTQYNAGFDTSIVLDNQPSHLECLNTIGFSEIEHHYTKEGEREYNARR